MTDKELLTKITDRLLDRAYIKDILTAGGEDLVIRLIRPNGEVVDYPYECNSERIDQLRNARGEARSLGCEVVDLSGL